MSPRRARGNLYPTRYVLGQLVAIQRLAGHDGHERAGNDAALNAVQRRVLTIRYADPERVGEDLNAGESIKP